MQANRTISPLLAPSLPSSEAWQLRSVLWFIMTNYRRDLAGRGFAWWVAEYLTVREMRASR